MSYDLSFPHVLLILTSYFLFYNLVFLMFFFFLISLKHHVSSLSPLLVISLRFSSSFPLHILYIQPLYSSSPLSPFIPRSLFHPSPSTRLNFPPPFHPSFSYILHLLPFILLHPPPFYLSPFPSPSFLIPGSWHLPHPPPPQRITSSLAQSTELWP